MKEVISSAENKKFTDFMDNIRPYLDQKLKDNIYFQQKATEMKKYQQMNNIFNQISNLKNN